MNHYPQNWLSDDENARTEATDVMAETQKPTAADR
jgi:hypothetical protein